MIGFGIAAALLSALAAMAILARASRASRQPVEDASAEFGRRQLQEIDDLSARGLLGEAEARSARAEAGRRVLAQARHVAAAPSTLSPAWTRRLLLAAALAAPLTAAVLYAMVGSPGLSDQPFAARLAGWRASNPTSLSGPQIEAVLRAAVREHPKQAQPLVYLAEVQAGAGRFAEASRNLRRAVALAPESRGLWTALGQAETAAAGGEAPASARQAFARALRQDPADPVARYHLARAQIIDGQVEAGLAAWRRLAADLPSADPRRAPLETEIAQTARTGRPPKATG